MQMKAFTVIRTVSPSDNLVDYLPDGADSTF